MNNKGDKPLARSFIPSDPPISIFTLFEPYIYGYFKDLNQIVNKNFFMFFRTKCKIILALKSAGGIINDESYAKGDFYGKKRRIG